MRHLYGSSDALHAVPRQSLRWMPRVSTIDHPASEAAHLTVASFLSAITEEVIEASALHLGLRIIEGETSQRGGPGLAAGGAVGVLLQSAALSQQLRVWRNRY